MTDERFSASPVLSGLKDFQRRTVDYVFDRLYGEQSTTRFLVADEVGLGKTLVARGLIARVLEHLQDKVKRIDVIYVCSNTAIAIQNVNRLNVFGKRDIALASRLTLLPIHIQQLAANKVNFVSFTPGTTFDLKSRGGKVEERALLFKILKGSAWNAGPGFFNMLQATVQNRDQWKRWAEEWEPRIDEELAAAFCSEISADHDFIDRLNACCEAFHGYREQIPRAESDERYKLLGELRHRLAKTCLDALEPDLVILDEFQRFKDLLDGEDEAALLARELFAYPEARTLLLSATPYKMLSLDHEQDDDHYPDFIRTLSFLFQNEALVQQIRREVQEYRTHIFTLTGGASLTTSQSRDRLQQLLLRVMCRTERVGMTQRLDAMMVESPRPAPIHVNDLLQAMVADHAALAVGAPEPIEYWKSSPYLLNFLRQYDLRRRIDQVLDAPPVALRDVLHGADGQILHARTIDSYLSVDPACARLRVLFSDTLDKGMWRLLWMPPSLPYTKPSGAYAQVGQVTKTLVFAAWNVVPDAIAAICSYEAERRMVGELDRPVRHGELYERLRPLLRFSKGRQDRLTGMPTLAWLLPSPALAGIIDPLAVAVWEGNGQPIAADALLEAAVSRIEGLLKMLPSGGSGNRADERWYWAAPAMLDGMTGANAWLAGINRWMATIDVDDPDTRFKDHVLLFLEAAQGTLALGPQPDDLPYVLATLALAAPGVCALRALQRVAPTIELDDPALLSPAVRIAEGFRTLFNIPESIALLRGGGEDSYWKLTLRYGLEGNIQAVLDEQVHMLVEQLGLVDHEPSDRVRDIAEFLAHSLSIRTARIKIDELKVTGETITLSDFNTRCRFALKFGDLRDDRNSTLARADVVRQAFNSPFRPFVLASTSIGQEGLDFHTWCHAVVHWNLPSNPVDLEQREGRVHRYKGHAIRKNIAEHYGLAALEHWDGAGDPWEYLFCKARDERPAGSSDLVPFWIYEEGGARVERRA
ncbi:helicase, partial [bacterium]|nr:helicase [candidate division CSSED10-310 bacterium]